MPEDVKEAPALFALTAQGKLPPVAERMPADVRVVQVLEEIGTYGGTWRRVCRRPGRRWRVGAAA